MKIGVLGVQGDVREHVEALHKLGVETLIVKLPEHLDMVDGLILPGGESTTMIRILKEMNMDEKLVEKINDGLPVFATCAGVILLAKRINNYKQEKLGVLDVTVERNAYGRQVESFETFIEIPAIGKDPFRAIFIRAPRIVETGRSVEILAYHEGDPVLVKEGKILASTFHPELTDDLRLHRYFLEMVK
ncbi:pyridoxal 5'-phosphate synthase glutaminase subunit PdxT [Thermotoga neapolitana]|uniref:Pyridoxal 5'-phosphate synthase subunit PdxT n=1 Tax=Thermotoga neapolitana (strain ATCC 49049 / DSM 4359 / NBRC 107923 / NS-E) TaxID=309803 RepID=PDXT_THENN|nr:pyridoxal 5'-phosphate synthase glutaminase subunit PdxT [Thermotoga neapolitana]B9KBI1.1 RecName: Full=Pyridoxal 5'-phosphate synthase subunit PdxT; AltName: Full=Pdx2; AltName: Full=Pyridoxal 5'-phosphate synthase glutaminase subunit [Thermotoga neapolitana DSM 4359]ACM22377.1 Glutamine amidotransferase subunit pdxT [Thermotoga neapolitana DSM 4359]KFZ22491.1 glutamine amidotransferase subunit PdxT [Thermotoga neapolitana LA10]HBF11192.1 pyridoxal 5'-phosphate synthase glutaminase subunit 